MMGRKWLQLYLTELGAAQQLRLISTIAHAYKHLIDDLWTKWNDNRDVCATHTMEEAEEYVCFLAFF